MFYLVTALFTQQKRASPGDGLITQSTRARGWRLQSPTNAGALLCCVWRKFGGGSRLNEGKTMSNDRMTVVPDFLGELDAGVFMNKIAAALNTTALGVLNNGNKGKVVLTFDFERMGNSVEEKRVKIKHKLNYSTPTPRGKASEEDTTETPMWVNKGGKLTILQEDQGQLFGITGAVDGKLKAAQ